MTLVRTPPGRRRASHLAGTCLTALLGFSLTAGSPAHATFSPDGPAAPYGAPSSFLPASGLLAVGDIDGNGVKDVLESRELAGQEGRARDVGIIARDGRRGVELWRRTVRVAGYEGVHLKALRRGGNNRPMALMTIEGGQFVDGTFRQTRRLLGLDLESNTFVWRHGFTDVTSTGSEGSTRCAPCTRTAGLVPTRTGPGQDVLLTTIRSRPAQSRPPSYDGGPPREATPPADVQLRRLDTATGAVSDVGSPFLTDQPDPEPEITPDLDGDSRDDVLLRGDVGRTITAVSSASGAALWRSEKLPLSTSISRTHPDASGRRDLIVPTLAAAAADDYDERPATDEREIALVDAATGQTRWRRAGVQAQPLGTAAGLPLVAVLDVTTSRTDSSGSSTATVTAVDPAGLPRWSASSTLTSTAPNAALNADGAGGLHDAGDTDGDGQRDLLLVHQLMDGNAFPKRSTKRVSGADGALSRDLSQDTTTLLAPLRGAAPDLFTTSKVNGQPLVLIGLDGQSGSSLWRRAMPGSSGATRAAVADAVRLYPTGCRSLLVTGYPRLVHSVVRADGVPAWTVVPSTTALFGGQLIAGTAATATC